MFTLAFLLENPDNTAECLVPQRQRRAQQHDEQQPGVSLGRAFGTRYLDGHRTGFTCGPPGQTETCLLAQVFPCANIELISMDCNFHNKKRKPQKHDRGVGEDNRGEIRQHDGGIILLSFAFILLVRLLQTLRLILLLHFGRVDSRAWGGNSRQVVVQRW
jgi:hypothetical protein